VLEAGVEYENDMSPPANTALCLQMNVRRAAVEGGTDLAWPLPNVGLITVVFDVTNSGVPVMRTVTVVYRCSRSPGRELAARNPWLHYQSRAGCRGLGVYNQLKQYTKCTLRT
jgi:hypothetical protein